jgi:YidC/Oxa1 family membrane protein insertase
MIADIWNTLIFYPIMNGLLLLYSFFGNNLGWAIIVLTVVLKFILFPFTKGQLDSSRKLKVIQPKLEKLQKKYKRNPKKLQEEQVKLYKEIGYNPLGCLFSIILPFPILLAIYQAIRTFSGNGDEIVGIYSFVRDFVGSDGVIQAEDISKSFYGILDLSQSYLPLAQDKGYISLQTVPYLFLALLTGLSQYLSVKYSSSLKGLDKPGTDKVKGKKKSSGKKKTEAEEMTESMTKSMSLTFPLMTSVVALSMPSAVAVYWIIQSGLNVAMQLLYNKVSKNKK